MSATSPPRAAVEPLAGGGRAHGGSLTLDVQVGPAVRHAAISNGRPSAESTAVLAP